MSEKLRIGIIGTGGIAHSHMRSYLKMDDVEIVGASDIVPGKARAFLDEFGLTGVPAFENNDDLIALKPDGVSVCTYNTCPVYGKDHRKVLHTDILHYLVIGSLQKR